MKTILRSSLIVLALFAFLLPAAAQQQRLSPHETISAVVDGNRITVVYGRPYAKHPQTGETRKIWGTLVPYGKIWRTGADEATLLITQKPIEIGGVTIPAGAYTLWTLPTEDGHAKLIINKQVGQWGAGREEKNYYDAANDVGRVELKKEALEAPVAQFTISITPEKSGGATLKLAWENAQFSAPVVVKK